MTHIEGSLGRLGWALYEVPPDLQASEPVLDQPDLKSIWTPARDSDFFARGSDYEVITYTEDNKPRFALEVAYKPTEGWERYTIGSGQPDYSRARHTMSTHLREDYVDGVKRIREKVTPVTTWMLSALESQVTQPDKLNRDTKANTGVIFYKSGTGIHPHRDGPVNEQLMVASYMPTTNKGIKHWVINDVPVQQSPGQLLLLSNDPAHSDHTPMHQTMNPSTESSAFLLTTGKVLSAPIVGRLIMQEERQVGVLLNA